MFQSIHDYFFGSEEDNTNLPEFVNLTKTLDKIRNENITETFPELKFLFDE